MSDFELLMDGYEKLLNAHVSLLREMPEKDQEYLLTVSYPFSLGDDIVTDIKAVMELHNAQA